MADFTYAYVRIFTRFSARVGDTTCKILDDVVCHMENEGTWITTIP